MWNPTPFETHGLHPFEPVDLVVLDRLECAIQGVVVLEENQVVAGPACGRHDQAVEPEEVQYSADFLAAGQRSFPRPGIAARFIAHSADTQVGEIIG